MKKKLGGILLVIYFSIGLGNMLYKDFELIKNEGVWAYMWQDENLQSEWYKVLLWPIFIFVNDSDQGKKNNAPENSTIKTKFHESEVEFDEDIIKSKKTGVPITGIVYAEMEAESTIEFELLRGKPHGSSKLFYKDGSICVESEHKNGVKTALIAYYPNGQKKAVENFTSQGLKNGVFEYWSEDGIQLRDVVYKNDSIISEKCLDFDGEEIDCDKFTEFDHFQF